MEVTKSLIPQIYEAINARNIEQAVMLCMRLARLINDHLNSLIFMKHLHQRGKHGFWYLSKDMSSLPKEMIKFMWDKSLDVWLETHATKAALGDNPQDEDKVLDVSAGEIPDEIRQWESALADLVSPPGIISIDTAEFLDSFMEDKARIRQRLKALSEIQTKILALCFTYASSIEKEIYDKGTARDFPEELFTTVDNFFKSNALDVYEKLQKANELLASPSIENLSLSLAAVRRAIKSSADYFLPPSKDKVMCFDGVERVLDDDRYLNRFQEVICREFSKSTSRELLLAEVENLSVFVRKINEIASKGVHNNVSIEEAKQGLSGLYFFLHNIIVKKLAKDN